MDTLVGIGTSWQIGCAHGEQLAEAVAANLGLFWRRVAAAGMDRGALRAGALAEERRALADARCEEIAGIASAARVGYPDLLAYNMYHGRIYPEECTVMWALPDATAGGRTLFMKNSDKIGREDMVGPNFYKNKEVNILVALRQSGKPAIIGVGQAGGTGLKMGINDRGVCAGTNIARTYELRTRAVTSTQERAVDRAQLARDGLELTAAMLATQAMVARVAESPMATPGNLEFVDSTRAFVIEGSYDRVAVQAYDKGAGSRTNRFVTLQELNDPKDLSSYCRFVRTQELLGAVSGRLTLDDFASFTRDHANGPGPNSICRHHDDVRSETTQSALVGEINGASPADSVVRVALGKPCHAWRHADGHIELTLRFRVEDIPEGLRTGEVWKRYWTEEPFEAAPAAMGKVSA
jgi:isopenicillin-N N-acyltransferase like protein